MPAWFTPLMAHLQAVSISLLTPPKSNGVTTRADIAGPGGHTPQERLKRTSHFYCLPVMELVSTPHRQE